jgi:hypothetical protein
MRRTTLFAGACRVRAVSSRASFAAAQLIWFSVPSPLPFLGPAGGRQGPRGLLPAALRLDVASISLTASESIDDGCVNVGARPGSPTRGRSRTERPAAVECSVSIFFRGHVHGAR